MWRSITAAATLLMLVAVAPAQAQAPFSLELRGGAAIPAEDLGDTELKTGGGFGFTASYLFLQHTLVYGGWDWQRMNTKARGAGPTMHVENTGYAFGLGFEHPLFEAVGGWVRAGGIYQHIELEEKNGDLIADSGHELGWEAGGGLVIPVGDRFALLPGARYRTFSADIDMGAGDVAVDMSYVTVDLGLAYRFGAPRPMTALRR
jgi:opacity protein-like surface antigen